MSKKTIKDIFNEKLNQEKIHENIIQEIERKQENKMKNVLKVAIPSLLLLLICGITFLSETKSTSKLKGNIPTNNKEENRDSNAIYFGPFFGEKNDIIINKVDTVGTPKVDGVLERLDVKANYYNIPYFKVLENLELPNDMNKQGAEKLFGRSNKDSKVYDKLLQYQFYYFNEDNARCITVAFSDMNKPVRDYLFPDDGKSSTIHGVTLNLYQYEDSYMTQFQYEGYYFDIEAYGVTEKEFITFLKTLIK